VDRNTEIGKLKEAVASGRVVTIVGTGVSVAATAGQQIEGFSVATWPGLLNHGAKHCRDLGLADDADLELWQSQIASGKTNFLLNAAQDISERLHSESPGVFRGWLKQTVGKLELRERALIDAVAAIPGVLATLNYDGLLSQATGRRAITWKQADAVEDLLQNSESGTLHLHGHWEDPDSVVLGLESYLRVRSEPHARAVLSLFAIGHTFLFVGCGDTIQDPNFVRLIEWAEQALRDVEPRHFLLCRTSELDEFRKKLSKAPWLRPLDYGADYSELLPFVTDLLPLDRTTPTALGPNKGMPRLDLEHYKQTVRKRYGKLKLEELDATTHDIRPLTLTGMFVAPKVRELADFMPGLFELPKDLQQRLREAGKLEGVELDDDALAEKLKEYQAQTPLPVAELLSDAALRRVVVLGDPGSGKSSLLQFQLLSWADAPSAETPLALLLELREYARLRQRGEVEGFLDFLGRGESVRCRIEPATLDAWLREKPSIVLFDGLDEIFDAGLRREVTTAIQRFADDYGEHAKVVVTSRVIGYQHQSWRDENFRAFMLQELDQNQIADFLARWHENAYESPERGEAKRALLARAISDSPAIRQLAGNPLLLTMMAILNRTQDLPRDRAELYEQCGRLLLHQWKIEPALAQDSELAKASLDFKDKRGLLLRVARAMQTTADGLAGNLIDEATLERALADGLAGIPQLRAERAARALIEQLRGRNFMLCSVGTATYAFVHRTFLEYFCAVDIRERFQTERALSVEQLESEVFSHWPDETWHEVLSLLAGMLAPRFAAQMIGYLLDRAQTEHGHRAVLLAARCVAEVRKRAEIADVVARVRAETEALTQLRLTSSGSADDDVRAQAIRRLAMTWSEDDATRVWLCSLVDRRMPPGVAATALDELCRGFRAHPETLPMVKAAATWHNGAIVAILEHWPNDAETVGYLKSIATPPPPRREGPELSPLRIPRASELHAAIRNRLVADGVAKSHHEDPGTVPWIKALALSHTDLLGRNSVLEVLCRNWANDADILAFAEANSIQPD